ncbi:hypothetical protein G6514_006144 [Epicoccum nigrum]|nr:hypothetical protein G6514_006144 [Epicoccum nigrum]
MQFTFLAGLVAAVAVGVEAQTSISPEQSHSVLMVLATALPSDARSSAIASPSAFAADMSSALAAGNPPGWYASMPADVKSILPLLYPATAEATTTPVVSSAATAAVTSAVSSVVSALPTTGANSTSISEVHSATLPVAVSSAHHSATSSPTASPSTGAASHAKAAVGAGLAGVAGFVAILAL